MFLHLSVILFTGGSAIPLTLGNHQPPGQTPPNQVDTNRAVTPLHSACWDTVNKRAVRILLECSLVCLVADLSPLMFKFQQHILIHL